MIRHNETPPLTGSIVSNGGSGTSKAVRSLEYPFRPFDAMSFAAAIVASRHRLPITTAKLIAELAGLGGRRA